MSAMKKGYVPRTFYDAEPEKHFEGGKEHEFTEGEYANYFAAGLIGDKPEKLETAAGPTAKP